MALTIVHAADLHLDSPMNGLDRYEGAPVAEMREATRRALVRLVDLCRDEQAAILLLAGDIYDGNWRDYNTGLFFAKQMARLREADVQVVMVRGNHDAESRVARSIRLPENVRNLSTRHPESVEFKDIGVAVHGQGYAQADVREDLAAGYPKPRRGLLNIGLLHTCLDGREGHEPYAPCRLPQIVDKGYDYWALGHVHASDILHERPWVVFPGNTQGRHARETGPKGAMLIRVDDDRIIELEHKVLDVVRWVECRVDLPEEAGFADIVDLAGAAIEHAVREADQRTVAARVVLRGRTRAHGRILAQREQFVADLRAAASDAGEAWVEKVVIATNAVSDTAAPGDRDDPLGELRRVVEEVRTDDAALAPFLEELKALAEKLPPEMRTGLDGVGLDAAAIRKKLDETVETLLPKLVGDPAGERSA